jgi:hypothetical protein
MARREIVICPDGWWDVVMPGTTVGRHPQGEGNSTLEGAARPW